MKYEYIGFTPDKGFAVAMVSKNLTTFEFYSTREQAEWALQTGKEILAMLGVTAKHYMFEREPQTGFRGIWGDEIGMN